MFSILWQSGELPDSAIPTCAKLFCMKHWFYTLRLIIVS